MKINTKNKIALARAIFSLIRMCRVFCGLNDRVHARRNGINWQLELHEGIDFSIWLLGGFEPTTLKLYRKILKNKQSQIVFDIGANIGAHTLPLAQLVTQNSGEVYAFEPTVWAFGKLLRNLALNPQIRGVTPVQAMLTAERDLQPEAELYSSWPLICHSSGHPVHLGQLKATTGAVSTTLDDYVIQKEIQRVDFIKLDVDGHELEVIAGAWQTLERFKPMVLMEWAPYLFLERTEIMHCNMDRLLRMGYRFFDAERDCNIYEGLKALNERTPKGGSINVLLKNIR